MIYINILSLRSLRHPDNYLLVLLSADTVESIRGISFPYDFNHYFVGKTDDGLPDMGNRPVFHTDPVRAVRLRHVSLSVSDHQGIGKPFPGDRYGLINIQVIYSADLLIDPDDHFASFAGIKPGQQICRQREKEQGCPQDQVPSGEKTSLYGIS